MSLIGGMTVFVIALTGTAVLRRYALARSILDIPNDRSSHRVPTPRGGGIAVVFAFLAATLALWASKRISPAFAIALTGAGSLVALVGFLDDHEHIAARWRLLAHFVAAAWALAWLGGLPPIAVGASVFYLGAAGDVVAVFALVWLLNLYNFMDGIDGIASIEAITVCIGAIVLYVATQAPRSEICAPALLASATLGFLLWNFPPAKIFMGDAGSGFLGLMLGILAVRSAALSPAYLWSWIILLGCFVADATVTLVRRIGRREKLYEAHRNHAYQHAARRFRSHRPVALAVGTINLVWLLPVALLVGSGRLGGFFGVLIAYVPLIGIAIILRAGHPTRE
jgi:Fuc2NAc and GlcNAc transferase